MMSENFEQEVETLIRTAVGEENENGSPMLAAQCYANALQLLVHRTKAIGVNEGFLVSMRTALLTYLDRARLLAEISVDEEKAMKG